MARVSLNVIKNCINNTHDYYFYWISKLIGKHYPNGRATISQINGLLKSVCNIRAYEQNENKLLARLDVENPFYQRTHYQAPNAPAPELSLIVNSDQTILENYFGLKKQKHFDEHALIRDRVTLPDECLKSLHAFKKVIIHGALQTAYFRNLQNIASMLSIPYRSLKGLTFGIDKTKIYLADSPYVMKYAQAMNLAKSTHAKSQKALFLLMPSQMQRNNLSDNTPNGTGHQSPCQLSSFTLPAQAEQAGDGYIPHTPTNRGYQRAYRVAIKVPGKKYGLVLPIGVHVDREPWFRYFPGRNVKLSDNVYRDKLQFQPNGKVCRIVPQALQKSLKRIR